MNEYISLEESKVLSPEKDNSLVLIYELRKERIRRKFTQEELARKAGLSQSKLSKIENFTNIPRIDTLMKIADALDTKIILFK
ncbi:helix-turn-helix domain-containing protein [Latilactobacillus sakei]|uniref:helix-turn-helix domain-containing protein n=1 Tax=Latilactobacillus sakei TaxID=1599 RepID=UPI002072D9D7|nr:helix-turn-helix transcriptional regulator [Latilactobacillus sakei]